MTETIKVEGITSRCYGGKVTKNINQLIGVSSVEIDVDNNVA